MADPYFTEPEEAQPQATPYFDDTVLPPPVPQSQVQARAEKYHLAIGEGSPGAEQLAVNIQNGTESADRIKAVNQEAMKLDAFKMHILDNYAQSKQGGPTTPEEQNFILGLTKENLINPDTIFEKQYARKALTGTLMAGDSQVMDKGLNEVPDETQHALEVGEEAIARKEAFQKIAENTEATYNEANPATRILSHVETWVPGASSLILRSSNDELSSSSVLPGSIKQDMIDRFYQLPLDQAVTELKATVENLRLSNPLLAVELTQAVMAYSNSDRHLDNLFEGINIASVVPIGAAARALKGGAAFVKEVNAARAAGKAVEAGAAPEAIQAVKQTVKPYMARSVSPQEALASAGHTDQAAIQGAIQDGINRLSEGVEAVGPARDTVKLLDNAPALFNPASYVTEEARGLSLEMQRRLSTKLDETTPSLLRALNEGIRVDQLTEEQIAPAVIEAYGKVRTAREYPEIGDNVLGVDHAYSQTANTHYAEVKIGDEGATLFKSGASASETAKAIGLKGYTVEQQGSGFYLKISHPVDNTDPIIRNIPISLENTTPRSASNVVIGWLKGAEETLSKESRADRIASVYGPGGVEANLKVPASRIGELAQGTKLGNWIREKAGVPPKKDRAELFDFIEHDRSYETKTTDGITEVGRTANNWLELWDRWYEHFGHYPTEQQMVAYGEAVRLNDFDWVSRNLGIYSGKVRKGIKSHSFGIKVQGPQGDTAIDAIRGVEAKSVDALPDIADDYGILILRDSGSQYVRKSELTQTQRDLIDHLQKQDGHRIFQVPGFGSEALKKNATVSKLVGEDKVHFVLSNRYDIRPLSIKQLPKRPGFHLEYPDGYYVSQPVLTTLERAAGVENRYDGDKNVWQFTNRAQANKFSKALEHVRVSLKNKELTGLDEFIAKNLPKTPAEIKGMFFPKLDTEGKIISEATLSLDHPIATRFAGEKLGDTMQLSKSYSGFKDSSKDPLNLYSDVSFEFAGKRNPIIDTIDEVGTETNPVFKIRPAKMVDAMTTMNRAMKGIIESKYLNDLKGKEVEKFIREFGDQLDVDPRELALNPLPHLLEPKWKSFGTDLDRAAKQAAARQSNQALRQFLGTSTKFSNVLRASKQKLADSIYNLRGKPIEMLEPWLMSTTNDPLVYFRALAFHTKLGLFNPVQLFLQAQGFTHVMAVAGPVNAVKAGGAFTLMRGLRFTTNKSIIASAAKKAKAFGWKEDDFVEAYNALRESGMDRVGGEVAMRDSVDPELFKTASGTFAKWSGMMFNEGERFVRMSAHNAAYLEWRLANPAAKFTNKVAKSVLQRADLMSINMSRASNAAWQRGWASIPTQFFAYQARLMEQMLGKRLTGAEKTRALGFYSLLYGMPVGASAATGIWPWGDVIRKELLDRGIDYDDNVATRLLMDGMASVAVQAMTGTKYNVGGRYGPGGINAFHDWLTGTKDGNEFGMGVSGTTIGSMIQAAWPIAGDMFKIASGDPDGFPLLGQDLMDFGKEISTGGQLSKAYVAYTTHKYVTKNGNFIDETEGLEPFFIGISGLTPQRISDTFLTAQIQSEHAKAVKEMGKLVSKDWRRALESDDPDETQRLLKRGQMAMELADMDPKERASVLSQVLHGYQSYASQTAFEFAQTSDARMQRYLKEQARRQR